MQLNKRVEKAMKLSHEGYVQKQRHRAAEIARGMLNGSTHYLEGAIELASLVSEVGLSEDDKDFIVFKVISSETGHLPIGSLRKYWSKESLARNESEMQRSIKWAKEISLSECESIAERFNA